MIKKKAVLVAVLTSIAAWSAAALAAASAPYQITPQLVQAAQKEGKVVLYTSLDLRVGQALKKAFEAKYPGVQAEINVSGSERNFQRVNQEYGSQIYNVDIIDSPDAFHFSYMKRKGWLKAAVPQDVTSWPKTARDADGFYAADRATLTVMAYNTKLVKAADAPKRYMDLLDPTWKNQIVKANPAYSGTIMVDTYNLAKTLGWDYFKGLGKQNVMQIQSATETPNKVAQGEREVMADGTEYNVILLREAGAQIQEIYPTEGSPLIVANAGILAHAPHPNAALLFYSFLYSMRGQQILVDVGRIRSLHPGIREGSMKPLAQIKLLQSDPAEIEHNFAATKENYAKYLGNN
jgi:iron(III) transport system substrate-binding protein